MVISIEMGVSGVLLSRRNMKKLLWQQLGQFKGSVEARNTLEIREADADGCRFLQSPPILFVLSALIIIHRGTKFYNYNIVHNYISLSFEYITKIQAIVSTIWT